MPWQLNSFPVMIGPCLVSFYSPVNRNVIQNLTGATFLWMTSEMCTYKLNLLNVET